MSSLSALGARNLPASLYAANTPTDGKAKPATSHKVAGLADSSPTSLSSTGIDLQKRLDSVGNSTIDYAQNLLGSFAQSLFGDAAKGATISFDSASLEASSSFAVGVQHSESANGVTDAAALQLNDSSHFLGKGMITTADGRKFDFEVEVQYSSTLSASASQTTSTGAGQNAPVPGLPAPTTSPANGSSSAGSTDGSDGNGSDGSTAPASSNTASLPAVVFPNIDFPGTLADLFKLIGHDLTATLSTQGGDKNQGNSIDRNTLRSLSLRLLSLADHKSLDTYSAAGKAKGFGATPASTVPASATDSASATAGADSAAAAPVSTAATSSATPAASAPADTSPSDADPASAT